MARFIPAEQVQQQAMPQGAGMDAADYLGLAKTGVGLAGQAGRFLSVPGAEYAGPVGPLLGLGQGIATDNPVQAGQSGANASIETLKLLDKLGLLGGTAPAGASAGSILAGMGGGGGVASALAPTGSAALTGAGGVGTALAGEGAALGGAGLGGGVAGGAAAGAEGAALGAGTGLSAGLGVAAIPLFFIALGLNNMMAAEAKRKVEQTKESAGIRQAGSSALNQLQGTSALAQNQRFIPADQLPAAMNMYRGALDAGPSGNQLLSTRGVGGQASQISPLSDAQLEAYRSQYEPALQNSQVGYTRAADASAQLGQLPDWALTGFGTTDPAALLQSLGTGFNPYWDVNYSNVVPGNYGQQLPAIMQNFDPNYAQSATAQRFQQIPAMNLPGQTPLTPDQIAAFNQTRQDTATTGLNNYIAGINDYSGADQSGINASGNIGAGAPYLGGGSLEAAQALGLAPQTISDLKSGQTDWQTAVRQEQLRKLSGGVPATDAP